jgi:hypothetical protein
MARHGFEVRLEAFDTICGHQDGLAQSARITGLLCDGFDLSSSAGIPAFAQPA